MTIHNIELYESLKPKLGEKEAKDLLVYIHETVSAQVATKEDVVKLDGRLGRLEDAVRHLDEKAATKEDLARVDGRIGRLEEVVPYLATKQQVAEVAGHLTAQLVELSGHVSKLELQTTDNLQLVKKDLESKFRFYFVALAALVVLTNPKAIELFGKLMGLVK